jgi:hypothetical protein
MGSMKLRHSGLFDQWPVSQYMSGAEVEVKGLSEVDSPLLPLRLFLDLIDSSHTSPYPSL